MLNSATGRTMRPVCDDNCGYNFGYDAFVEEKDDSFTCMTYFYQLQYRKRTCSSSCLGMSGVRYWQAGNGGGVARVGFDK